MVSRRMQTSPSPAEETVDLREYVDVLRRRKILVLAVLIGFTILAASYSFTRTPVYTAQSEVVLLPASNTSFRPDQLVSMETEARLVRSAQVAAIAQETLGWPVPLSQLLDRTQVKTTPDALVLDIFFTNKDPQQAAEASNAFAEAYLAFKRQRSEAADIAVRQRIQDQIDDLQRERTQLDRRIIGLDPGSAAYLDAQEDRDILSGQIAVFMSQMASLPPVADPGEVILPASPPETPSAPKHTVHLAMGLFFGAFLGIVFALVRDRMDERIGGRSELEAALGAPVLASIARVAGWKKRGPAVLVTDQQPRSPAAEAYRTLRTGVLAMSRQRGSKVFAIVSPLPGEGKSSTSANLAVSLAQTDNRVLAISADLRQPGLHRYFRMDNKVGLADVLLGDVPLRGGDAGALDAPLVRRERPSTGPTR